MTTLFNIAVGQDEETKVYGAILHSVTDDKVARVEGNKNLAVVMAQVRKLIKKRALLLARFPIPEPPSPILQPNGTSASEAPKLVVLP